MNRRALAITMTVAVVVCGGVALGAGQRGSAIRTRNIRAARDDVRSHLAAVELPPGAQPAPSEPPGDHGYLKPLGVLEADGAHVVADRWWTVAGDPAAAIAYVEAHPPAGSSQFATGSGGNSRTGSSERSVDFEWPAVGGVLGYRELALTATAVRGGVTGLLVEAQSDWIVPRPASERVPAGVHEIDLTAGVPGRPPRTSLAVTGARKLARIVAVIDGLAPSQPIVFYCPLLTDPRAITLSFRARAGGPALARVDYVVFRPWLAPGGPCSSSLVFTIRGRRQAGLLGGRLIGALQRILGTKLRL
jgi:hypothetical protein